MIFSLNSEQHTQKKKRNLKHAANPTKHIEFASYKITKSLTDKYTTLATEPTSSPAQRIKKINIYPE